MKDNQRVWCGSVKGFMQSGRSPGDSLFKQSETHMSTTLFWAPLSPWQSHPTHREQGAQHLLSPFKTPRLLIAVPAFIELQPSRGKWQVQSGSGALNTGFIFNLAGGCCLPGLPPGVQSTRGTLLLDLMLTQWLVRSNTLPTGQEAGRHLWGDLRMPKRGHVHSFARNKVLARS